MTTPERGPSLFTSHGVVLLTLAQHPDCTIQGITAMTGLGRSTVHSVLSELKQADMVTIHKQGRRNAYEINGRSLLGHPSLREHTVGDLLKALFTDTGNN